MNEGVRQTPVRLEPKGTLKDSGSLGSGGSNLIGDRFTFRENTVLDTIRVSVVPEEFTHTALDGLNYGSLNFLPICFV